MNDSCSETALLDSVEECVDRTIAAVGNELIIASPLGLGKPVQLLNAFYHRVAGDPSLSMHLITALCLEVPKPASDIEAGLADPIMERLFRDYEELAFMAPLRAGTLPPNITISEFYVRAGSMVGNDVAQQNYISSNYTHIARDMENFGVNVMAQLVATREDGRDLRVSLSCNPDVSLELFERIADSRRTVMKVAQVHPDLPFMAQDAEVSADTFDLIVRNPQYDKALFAVPNGIVPLRDYAAALHASSLVVDGGTLQVGIGALGDAVAHACILRHQSNGAYRELLDALETTPCSASADQGAFTQGLYVSTEMFVNGILRLVEEGIVKRRVYDDLQLQTALNEKLITEQLDGQFYDWACASGFIPRHLDAAALTRLKHWGILDASVSLQGDALDVDGTTCANDMNDEATRSALKSAGAGRRLRHGRYLHAGFFLGPRDFYRKLREMDTDQADSICMTGVRRTNQLLLDYPLYSAQRRDARFINTGMKVTLSGAVASDALENGTVISGVGGQYNFVAMAHDLPGARSILCVRSTRGHGDSLESNIVPAYGHATIPRHLRDVVVTEYGIADLRGQSDSEVMKRLIAIADSRFQKELLEYAQRQGKIEKDYTLPEHVCNNTPVRLEQALGRFRDNGLLPDYPFGTELTEREIALAASLRRVKSLSEDPPKMIKQVFRALLHREDEEAARPWLERIHLEHPGTPREFLIQQLLLLDLEERGLLKVR